MILDVGSPPLTLRKFTLGEYQRITEAGILQAREQVELIEGTIVQMTAMGEKHRLCVRRLNRLFSTKLLDVVIVDVQLPFVVGDDSEPEPDLLLLHLRSDLLESVAVRPEDIALLIEVYLDPTTDGYRTVSIARRGDQIGPLAFPDVQFAVTSFLG